ncbi:hypothetical protein GCM10009661_43490 [Catellatospora chokoriensis]|uniref:Capsular polysaccharide biosynthesis protein n=1 Tax=Catellatospora chokoriensis TaxID=310353 RepID=A0A8J3NQN1_9ACTN|nr:hypothetical protein Cch02nite_06440 [Catellatospora chokoriensis]
MVSVPLFLLVIALSPLVYGAVSPSYTLTSYVQMVPPLPRPVSDDPNAAAPPVNPWLAQGLQTIANAAIVTVQDKSIVETMESAGLSDTYTLELDSYTPMVKIEIVASSRNQARATADEIVRLLVTNIAQLQSQYGLATIDLISTRRLDAGSNIEKSITKQIAVAFIATMLGLGGAAGVVVLVDRALSLRRRRPFAAAPAGARGPEADPDLSGEQTQAVPTWPSDIELTAVISRVPEQADDTGKTRTAVDSEEPTQAVPMSADSTMVLPRVGKD